MEQPCYKCGQTVEQGVAFCPHCNAPQIRVSLPDPSESATLPSRTAVTEPGAASAVSSTIPSKIIRWPEGLRSAATAGLIAGIGMAMMGLFGLWMIVAGFSSVFLYRRRTRGDTLRPGAGARLGVVSGTFGFALFTLITVPTGFFRAMISEMVLKFGQRSDPQVQALTVSWLDLLKTPAGVAAWLICLFIVMIAASALGGALGGYFLGHKPRPQP